MSRAQPMDPAERRNALLDAARSVFAAKGYHRTGVADIIAEAGVARGTFYNYFDSKRAIFQVVLEEMMERVDGAVRPIDVQRSIPDQVAANIERIVAAVAEAELSRVLLTQAVGIDAEGDAAIGAFYQRALARLERALQAGQRMGIVAHGDAHLMASGLLGLLKEPVFQATLAGRPLDVARLSEMLFQLLCGGLFTIPAPETRQESAPPRPADLLGR